MFFPLRVSGIICSFHNLSVLEITAFKDKSGISLEMPDLDFRL